ncbi:MAG: PKD domain-containing protein, partial [Planctomycetes bacterium]|nr:PKD domain-containing protein [Planctomycetota bacterium]
MIAKSFHQNTRRLVLLSLLSIVVCFQLTSTNAVAQITNTSKLVSRATTRSESIRASFSHSPRYPVAGQIVQFTGTSTGNALFYEWDFGDGTTSIEANPTHIFRNSGFSKIALVVSNSTASKRTSKIITVFRASATATFVLSPATPGPGETVQFADTTTGDPTSWQWNFGDGGTSTAKNPTHTFTKEASYTVSLISNTSAGPRQGSKTVTVASMSVLTSSFTYTPVLPTTGQAVQFTNTSTGTSTSWLWSFGDGTTSTSQNPSHTYTTAGPKTVTLTATNSSGSRSVTQTVSVTTALTASFSYSPTSPTVDQAVQFTDASTGNPSLWQWNFGDGTASTSQNPSHSFTRSGTFAVSLTALNASDQDVISHTISVVSASTPVASFTYSPASPTTSTTVQFTDTSTGNPTYWLWNFNDGSTSSAENPDHAFSNSGYFNVTLNVSNADGSDSISKNIIVESGEGSQIYWVSPNGAATWANAKSKTPLSGTACCSMSTANANASAGDTVYLR